MEIIRTKTITAKDIFNSTSALPLKDMKDKTILTTGVLVKDKTDDEGKVTVVGYLKAEDGTMYATVSSTVLEQLEPLAEMVDGGDTCEVTVIGKKSNGNREYIQLGLV